MFFFLSKVLDLLATPLAWGLGLALVGVVLARRGRIAGALRLGRRRRRRLAIALPLAGALVLYAFSIAPVSNALFRSLELPVLRSERGDVTYDALIVLGGMIDAEATESSGELQYNETIERITVAWERLRDGRAASVLVSGGSSNPEVVDAIEARVLAGQLERWGIARDRIFVEDQSKNTHENALLSLPIIRAHGWQRLLLVTSAFHMRRAEGCFRAAGLEVDMLPVDFRSYDPARFSGGLVPRADRLSESTAALREHLGRLVYRVMGYTR